MDVDLDYNEALIVEREEGIRDIQGQILEVHETFKDLAQLVQEQGSSIGEKCADGALNFDYCGCL